MKQFLDLAKERYSVRRFKPDPIPDDILAQILEAARVAPSAKNTRPHKIYVLQSEQALAKVRALTPCAFDAPCVLVVGFDTERECKTERLGGRRFGETDVAIAMTHMMLCAWDLGIGSCYVGWFDPAQLREAFGIPSTVEVCALLPLGYAADDVVPNERHSILRDAADTIAYM
ncbi:MAG: nitroreductase family protein [Clostridia bacterium]|nr:nitroreductase family protein [Clostridia bacterium]